MNGHPDPAEGHYCHALAEAYQRGAESAGLEVRKIGIAQLDFPLIRTKADFESKDLPADIIAAQEAITWANHLLIIYPLWLGTMPALLKAFLEQVFRYGFALDTGDAEHMPKGLLKGKTASLVITMGMPAMAYRWFFGAHSMKSLERSVLKISGISPLTESLIGRVEDPGQAPAREKWLKKLEKQGAQGI